MTTLTILMPVYNEEATVLAAIDDATSASLPVDAREVIVIDDGSTDGSSHILRSTLLPANVKVLTHPQNRGKGAALRTGIAQATGDFTAILDADLEYSARDLSMLLDPLLAGDTNVVFGSRTWSSHVAYSFWYVMGNKAVTFATNVLFNCWISDVMTCHKVMRTELLRSLPLRSRGFGIEPELAARVLRSGERIYEVPVSYRARSREAGKKLTGADALRVLATLIRCRFL